MTREERKKKGGNESGGVLVYILNLIPCGTLALQTGGRSYTDVVR